VEIGSVVSNLHSKGFTTSGGLIPMATTMAQRRRSHTWPVNEHHSRLKKTINCIFNGVSTKYLENYLALLRQCRKAAQPAAFMHAATA